MNTVVIVGDFPAQAGLPEFEGCTIVASRGLRSALEGLKGQKADLLVVSLGGQQAVSLDELAGSLREDALQRCHVLIFAPEGRTTGSPDPSLNEAGRAEVFGQLESLRTRLRDWQDSRRQIQLLSRQIDEMQQQQQARESLLQKLVHDMKSPLTVMLIELGMLERWWEKQNEERFENGIFRLAQNCEELIGMIQNLLDINRLQQDSLEIRLTTLGLASVVREVLDSPPAILKKREIRMELDLRDTEAPLRMDPAMINRALVNLLAVSARLCPPKGSILLSSRQRQDRMEIRLECLGRSIDSQDCHALLDQFAHERWRVLGLDAGSGIGLNFGRLLIEAHQGRLTVSCPSGRGATFAVTLPLSASAD